MTAVYKAIAAVQGELAKVGIAKANRNSQQGYNFRGIDDVYAALSPLLAKHGLCVIPRVIERTMLEKTTSKGNPLFYVTVHAEFDFVSSEDGSKHTAATYGEAMDSGDKATNKAMSAAYKYAAFMTFAIPTEGDNDADATTHDVAATISQEQFTELQSLMDRSATTAEKICEGYKIDAVALLPAKSFPALKTRLTKIAEELEKVAA
jgi:ERF superfamily.